MTRPCEVWEYDWDIEENVCVGKGIFHAFGTDVDGETTAIIQMPDGFCMNHPLHQVKFLDEKS